MSLQHELRAEKLGRANDDPTGLESLRGERDLGGIRSEAGCNLLTIYLLSRWGRLFEPKGAAQIADSEAFQTAVVDAYVAAGCKVDEVAPLKGLYSHMRPGFRQVLSLRSDLSALGLVQALLAEVHPDMYPAVYPQLQRLEQQLLSSTASAPRR